MTALSLLLLISITPFLTVRYFLGSVDLVGAVEVFFSTLIANAVMNAVVIGASGFQSYISRGSTILFLGIIFSISTAIGVAGGSGLSSLQQLIHRTLGSAIAGAVIMILGLQIGRARLKLFSTFENPPSTGGIFVMALVFPILQGVALGSGGSITLIIISLLWLWLAFLIDRPHRASYRYRAPVSSR